MTAQPLHVHVVASVRTLGKAIAGRLNIVGSALIAVLATAASGWLATSNCLVGILSGLAVGSLLSFAFLLLRTYTQRAISTSERRFDAVERAHEAHSAQLARVLYFAKPGIDTAGSVSKLRSDVSQVLDSLSNHVAEASMRTARAESSTGNDVVEPRRSATYEALDPAQSPTRVGRIGGARSHAVPESAAALVARTTSRVASAGTAQRGPTVAAIVRRQWSLPTLDCSVRVVLPHTVRTVVSSAPVDLIFIDTAAFSDGPWSGALEAPGAHLYKELWESLVHARRRQIPIVVDTTGIRSSHFTDELLQYADATYSDGCVDVGHGDGVYIPSLSFFSSIPREAGDFV